MSYASATPAQRTALIQACERLAKAGHRASEEAGAGNGVANTSRLGNSDVEIQVLVDALETALTPVQA